MRFSQQMAGSARALNALLQEFMDEAQILPSTISLASNPFWTSRSCALRIRR
jgi:hypothetical protein